MIRPRRHDRGHLRLVHDRTQQQLALQVEKLELLLPLSMPHNVIAVDVRKFRYHDLEDAIVFVRPRWIFDFRRISRFDILAGNRNYAFRLFRQYDAGYADIMGMFRRGTPFKEMTRISLWQRVFQNVIGRDNNFQGPILVITEDLDEFSRLAAYFIKALNRSTKQNFGLSMLHNGFSNLSSQEWKEVM